MRIFIPTRGRANYQTTRRYLFLDSVVAWYPVTYVVPECEADEWSDVDKIVVPDDYKFSQIRDAIALQNNDPFHVCIDDDLYLYRRNEGTRVLRKATKQDTIELFQRIEGLFEEGYVHGGVSAREGNQNIEPDLALNTRCMRFHFYNADVLHREGFKFADVVTKQDFHCTLFLLVRGFPNAVIAEWAHNQDRGSNSSGGCSWYRNLQVMKEGAERLHSLYPDYVKVVEKETLGAWGGGVRTDVRISWKKAFDERPMAPSGEEE